MSNAQFWFLCYILFMIVSNTEHSKELQDGYGLVGFFALLTSILASIFGNDKNNP